MIVNKELNKFIRNHKNLCDKSEIQQLIDSKDYHYFTSNFNVSSFNSKRYFHNSGSRFKESCIITKTDYNSFIVVYYDGFKKK